MTVKQKIKTSHFLKCILRNIKPLNTDNTICISKPEFIFNLKKEETELISLITNLEREIAKSVKQKRFTCDKCGHRCIIYMCSTGLYPNPLACPEYHNCCVWTEEE